MTKPSTPSNSPQSALMSTGAAAAKPKTPATPNNSVVKTPATKELTPNQQAAETRKLNESYTALAAHTTALAKEVQLELKKVIDAEPLAALVVAKYQNMVAAIRVKFAGLADTTTKLKPAERLKKLRGAQKEFNSLVLKAKEDDRTLPALLAKLTEGQTKLNQHISGISQTTTKLTGVKEVDESAKISEQDKEAQILTTIFESKKGREKLLRNLKATMSPELQQIFKMFPFLGDFFNSFFGFQLFEGTPKPLSPEQKEQKKLDGHHNLVAPDVSPDQAKDALSKNKKAYLVKFPKLSPDPPIEAENLERVLDFDLLNPKTRVEQFKQISKRYTPIAKKDVKLYMLKPDVAGKSAPEAIILRGLLSQRFHKDKQQPASFEDFQKYCRRHKLKLKEVPLKDISYDVFKKFFAGTKRTVAPQKEADQKPAAKPTTPKAVPVKPVPAKPAAAKPAAAKTTPRSSK